MKQIPLAAFLAIAATLALSAPAQALELFAFDRDSDADPALAYLNECDGLIEAGEASPECIVVELICAEEGPRLSIPGLELEQAAAWLVSDVVPILRSETQEIAMPLRSVTRSDYYGWDVILDAAFPSGRKLARPAHRWTLEVGGETFILPTDGRHSGAVDSFLEKCGWD